MPIHNRRLCEVQSQTLASLGYSVERIERIEDVQQLPALVVADDLFFTPWAMRGFLKSAARLGPRNARAAMAISPRTESFVPAFQGPRVERADGAAFRAYECYYLREFDPQRPLEAQAELAPIRAVSTKMRFPANRYFEPSGQFVVPISPAFMIPIQHWSCLVAANMLGMAGLFLESFRTKPLAALMLPIAMALRSGSARPTRWLGKLYLAGRKCRIHPSAHLEAVLLADRVKIGPNAVVRGSALGEGASIGPGAVVEGCSIGPGATVDPGVVIRGCVVGAGANVGSFFMQFSVLGQGAVLCPDSGILDFSFRNGVAVNVEGQAAPVSCGSRFLGGCLGHRAFLGPGLRLAAGQELPNDCVLVETPRNLIRGLDRPLPEHVAEIDASTGRPYLRRRNRAA